VIHQAAFASSVDLVIKCSWNRSIRDSRGKISRWLIPRVLIVDDEAPFAEVLGRRPSRRKFDVLATYSSPEVPDVIENETDIDVVSWM
jgi:hypothetical protein